MQEMLLIILVIISTAIFAVLVWALREQQRLRYLVFPRTFVKQIHKRLLEAEKEKDKFNSEEHNTDKYFEKLAWWEITRTEYRTLLEGNLAVYNGRKTIQEAQSLYEDLSHKIAPYVIERMYELKKWRNENKK